MRLRVFAVDSLRQPFSLCYIRVAVMEVTRDRLQHSIQDDGLKVPAVPEVVEVSPDQPSQPLDDDEQQLLELKQQEQQQLQLTSPEEQQHSTQAREDVAIDFVTLGMFIIG